MRAPSLSLTVLFVCPAYATTGCAQDRWPEPEAGLGPADEKVVDVCDGVDNDGDGQTDEDTTRVPANYATVALGIANVPSGGTVCVAPGTRTVNLEMPAKSLTLKSTTGSANATLQGGLLGGNPIDSVLEFLDGSAAYDVTIEGFTITGGHGLERNDGGAQDDCSSGNDDNCNDGGGINVTPAAGTGLGTLTLIDVVLTGNGSDDDGGGLYTNGVDVVMEDVRIEDNDASDSGGGARIVGGSLDATDSDFTENAAGASGSLGGGGLALVSGSATLTRVDVTGNTASSGYGGGIAFLSLSGARTVSGININVSDNSATDGGGVYLAGASSSSTVTFDCDGSTSWNNLGIWSNTASTDGGGVYLDAHGTFMATDCDLGGNTAEDVEINGAYSNASYGLDENLTCSNSSGTCA